VTRWSTSVMMSVSCEACFMESLCKRVVLCCRRLMVDGTGLY